jgi:hypothetical protein
VFQADMVQVIEKKKIKGKTVKINRLIHVDSKAISKELLFKKFKTRQRRISYEYRI